MFTLTGDRQRRCVFAATVGIQERGSQNQPG